MPSLILSEDTPVQPEELQRRVALLRSLGSDDATTEAKSAAGGLPSKIWRSVSAFANTVGGVIILGLNESDGFKLAKGFDQGRILDALSDGLNGKQPKVSPVPPHEVEQMPFEGGVVVVVTVDPLVSGTAPCFVAAQGVQNGSYRRWDDQNINLSSYEIYQLRSRNERLELDRAPVTGATVSDLDQTLVDRLLDRLAATSSRAIQGTKSKEEQLQRLNILDRQGSPTMAGLLSVGAYPQEFFPQLFVDVTSHPGRAKSTGGPTRFLDREECEGPIPLAVDLAVQATARNLRTMRVVDGVQGIDVPEIPLDVLREAIVNALTHRDYSAQVLGQQVAVDIFPDRIEVTSPGGFWGGVTAETIDQGRSCSRNDALAKMLTRVPMPNSNATVCENQGSGVPRMVGAMRDRGLPVPHFKGAIDHVTVTLYRFGLLTPETGAWLDSLTSERLTPHQQMALVLARETGAVTPQDLRREADMDTDDARLDLDSLVDLRLLQWVRPDEYILSLERERPRLTRTESAVLAVLNPDTPMTIHEIAERTELTVAHLRGVLRDMVSSGLVTPTAPPTSRNRAYLIGEPWNPDAVMLPLR